MRDGMRDISIKTDYYRLVIANAVWLTNSEEYVVFQVQHIPKEYLVFQYMVELPSSYTPERWLLKLADKGKVKDADGRLVMIGVANRFIFFDYYKSGQILNIDYYGFTGRQVKDAILKALKPEPEVTEEDRAIFRAGFYSLADITHTGKPMDELIRKAKKEVK